MAVRVAQPTTEPESPLTAFSHCHQGILAQLEAFAGLPALVAAADRARHVAEGTLALFDSAVIEHHRDEERELFPAVERSAVQGAEADWVRAMTQRLSTEHRAIESLWKRLKADVKEAAAGKPTLLDVESVDELVRLYSGHAHFEEEHFLPLAEEILGRNGNHLAALGISLHMRHTPQPIGYI